MTEDAELLRQYAEDRSEPALTELVRRHIAIVHGTALRRLGGDAHHAADVAQIVFSTMARRASALNRHPYFLAEGARVIFTPVISTAPGLLTVSSPSTP